MSFPRYPKYKDSGVEWLGEVPGYWEVLRIKHLVASLEQGWSPQCEGFPVQSEDEWGVLKVGCVNGGVFRPEENKTLPPELEPLPELGLASGDLLISRANTRELVGSAAVALRDYPRLMLCDKLFRLRLQAEACVPVFLALYLGIPRVRGQIELSATGASSSMLNIGQSTILELDVAVPPSDEQTAIAAFLGRETTKIDALVAEQENLIGLLKEKRQAVISHAVTKGLDPSVPMKDSGVEWLGEVPAHWEIGAIKRFFAVLDGKRVPLSSEERSFRKGDFPYYGASGVIDFIDNFIFDEDLVLVSEDGANLLSRSTAIAFVARGKYWVNNHAHILRAIDGNLTYWAERIEAVDLTPFITGAAQPKLTIDALANLIISIPPTESERSNIEAFITRTAAELDALIAEAQSTITLLQERRTALISAAVTGQIDVR